MEEVKDVRGSLTEKIYELLDLLSTLEVGSDEHTKAVNDIEKLYKLALDDDKFVQDVREYEEKKESESKNVKNQSIMNYSKIGIDLFMFLLSIGVSARFLSEGFKFEETGAFRSTTFRMILPKILPNLVKK